MTIKKEKTTCRPKKNYKKMKTKKQILLLKKLLKDEKILEANVNRF